jgi:hypothetical protein
VSTREPRQGPRITPETEEGREYAGRPRTLSLERILAFSGGPLGAEGWPASNLHTDPGMAAEAGLEAPIASGLHYQGHLIGLLIDLFGDAWLAHGRMHVKFPRTVRAGEVVQAKVSVRAKRREAGAVVFELDAWCENQEAERVLVGTAVCPLSLDRGRDR